MKKILIPIFLLLFVSVCSAAGPISFGGASLGSIDGVICADGAGNAVECSDEDAVFGAVTINGTALDSLARLNTIISIGIKIFFIVSPLRSLIDIDEF